MTRNPLTIRTEHRYVSTSGSLAARVTNSAKANIKSEAYGYAIADATKAIELDPNFVKVLSCICE
jgi:stage V sporulation protein SpoVS